MTTAQKSISQKIVHTRFVRWMHWFNFPILAIMIYSGLRIYWADLSGNFVLGIADFEIFTFFPDQVNEKLNLNSKLALGMAYHFSFAWLFILNGLGYVVYTIASGHWRELKPGNGALSNAWRVILHDLHLTKKPLPEQDKYNSAQQLAYSFIIILGFFSVVTGFAIYKPIQLSWLLTMFGGYESAKLIHFILTISFIGFFLMHVAQVARAGLGNFLAMVTGYNNKAAIADTIDGSGQEIATKEFLSGRTRRSLMFGLGAYLIAIVGWNKFAKGIERDGDRIPLALRKSHELNEGIWSRLFRGQHLAQSYDKLPEEPIRVNGRRGLAEDPIIEGYTIDILYNGNRIDNISVGDIKALQKSETTIEHKCVEGWSHIVRWGGTQFSVWAEQYKSELGNYPKYVNLVTPDKEYYVSLDIETAIHPQTLLAYEINNGPLNEGHGAPIRLSTPLKYGIKQLKRIGSIEFSDTKGPDFWNERGYDWYSHL